MTKIFPRIYPILDSSVIPTAGRAEFLDRLGNSLADAGVTLLEYRNQDGAADAELLADAEMLRRAMPAGQVKLILDDRADLVERSALTGCTWMPGMFRPARRGGWSDRTGSSARLAEAILLLPGILDEPADYFSIGPVFATTTKQTEQRRRSGSRECGGCATRARARGGAGGGGRDHSRDCDPGAGCGSERQWRWPRRSSDNPDPARIRVSRGSWLGDGSASWRPLGL